jgi:hypothetical protein
MANPKFIITAGCSFTEYHSEDKFKTWSRHLVESLNCELTSIFLGKSSADNSYIATSVITTLSEIENIKDALVGVMWTGVNRFSIYSNNDNLGFTKQYNSLPHRISNKNYTFINPHTTTELSKIYHRYFHDEVGSTISTLKNILLVQNFLKLKGINYFFTEYSTDCISGSKYLNHKDIKPLYELVDKNYFLPVPDMQTWIKNNTNLQYYPNDHHPTPSMSKEFTSKVIIPHIKNMGYVQ